MDESLIGLPGADAASESRPEPVVSSDMRAARPESVCGSRSLRRPSISSSPGSVASLYHQRINEKHHGVVWATRKRTCFAESAAPGSHYRDSCLGAPVLPDRRMPHRRGPSPGCGAALRRPGRRSGRPGSPALPCEAGAFPCWVGYGSQRRPSFRQPSETSRCRSAMRPCSSQ